MLFFMVTFMKKSICFHHQGIDDRGSTLYVIFTNPYMVSNKCLEAGSVSFNLLYKILVSFNPNQIILCLHKHVVIISLLYCYILMI
jgi:hypothetical protein